MKLLDKKELTTRWLQFVHDIKLLLTYRPDPESYASGLLILLGTAFSFILAGALYGFVYAYKRIAHSPRGPVLIGQPSALYASMIAWGFIFPAVAGFLWYYASHIESYEWFNRLMKISGWLVINLLISMIMMFYFRSWRNGIFNYMTESSRYGTATFAEENELQHYSIAAGAPPGFYIGDYRTYSKSGHLLTVAGTRGGKGVNLIIPNFMNKMGTFPGSWVVIDPKGENAAVTARIMRERGRKVVILNPWDLLGLGSGTFNPLDILKLDRLNLSDDVQMIAEAIVPMTADGDTDHFNNRARTIIAGLLLHLVTALPDEKKNLATLWEWLRLPADAWAKLLGEMSKNQHPAASEIVQATANEVVTLMEQSEREYGSVISTAQKWTDFLKSPALRQNLTPGNDIDRFKPSDLTNQLTVLYVVIPADRLKTHSQWLRLVSTSLMRSVIRQPQTEKIKPLDVCFLLDEAYALGYLSEIAVGLGSYAGYGVHIWTIYQNLVQIADSYGNNWENFISSCSVRHFFNVSDNTTADYVSKMMGTLSVPTYDALGKISGSTGRNLVNPDELRQSSSNIIYTIIDDLPPARLKKRPYYLEKNLHLGEDYDQNPYIR